MNRFWSKVEKTETCWLWTAAKDPNGYGRFMLSASEGTRLAHRFSYTLMVGEIPAGLGLDHLCRNPSCVNPDHLEPVTQAENMRRAPWTAVQFQSAKTSCPSGHEYSPDNTYINPRGSRECRACRHRRITDFHNRKRSLSRGAA